MRTLIFGIMLSLCLVGCGATATTPTPPPATSGTVGQSPVADATDTAPAATTEPSATTAPTIEPTEAASPTEEATATSELVVVPPAPTSLFEVESWLIGALESGATADQIRDTLLTTGWLENENDLREVPLQGDDQPPLWLLRVVRPVQADETPNPWGLPGQIYIVDPIMRQTLYAAEGVGADMGTEEAFLPAPTVLTDTDFTGDGILDILFEFTNCGANTCTQEYHIVSYANGDGVSDIIRATGYDSQGSFVEDLPYVQMSYSEAYLGDDQGDSITDLQLVGGTVGSVGAGPQRARSETYAWDGEHVSLFETTYEETDFRYFKLLDANIAFDVSDYETALTLYQEAATSETLQPSGWYENPEQETDAIKRYATFRIVVTSIILEDYIGAQRTAEEFVAAYPDDAVAAASLQVVMTYAQTQSLADACAEATAALSGQVPDLMAPLNDMGYANPALGAETVCPVQD